MYLDANIFIYAFIGKGEKKEKCRLILKNIENGRIQGKISVLVLDEVFWILKKEIGEEEAIEARKIMLSLPEKILKIDEAVALRAIELIERYDLKPRDAIHSAIVLINDVSILTDDDDFDVVGEIDRKKIEEV